MGFTTNEPRYNVFARDLLDISATGTNDYLSSPISVFLLLTTLLGSGGPKGNTKVQIAEALELDDTKEYQKLASRTFALLYHNLTNEKIEGKQVISIGNGMFLQNETKIKPHFLTRMKNIFHNDVFNVDFTKAEDARKNINEWVSNKTSHLIPTVLKEPLPPTTLLGLINTLYFKGKWKKPFSNHSTTEGEFKPNNQPIIKIPMMHIMDSIEYGLFPKYKIHMISKSFMNPRFSFIVILPTEPGKLEYADNVLRGEIKLPHLVSKLESKQVALSLPKFRLDFSIDLIETLKNMYITDLFDSAKADLRGITDSKVHVQVLQHSVALKVNEDGVEAAAATVMGIGLRSARPPPSIRFDVNESFICYVYDKILKTSLFAGRIIKPVPLTNNK
ncbi:putative serpin [Schistosoma mansoni]|uniref:Putative serpin n=1 Tax=Schistosoma mansoni TaxID=6183 RepID=G4V6W4_SCHMA|nr:putative serpin [Schistosoma mansoni]|eukprot:XP_018647692.1 putative serpin [Schistosoma mansoni]